MPHDCSPCPLLHTMHRRHIANVAVGFHVDNDKPNSGSPKSIVKVCNNEQNNNNNNKIKIYTTSSKTSVTTILAATATVTVNVAVIVYVDNSAELDTSCNRFYIAIKLKRKQTQLPLSATSSATLIKLTTIANTYKATATQTKNPQTIRKITKSNHL
ncbi:uncharacterized protein LOC120768202 [Bactrocera tryoni]|uniref:uncharacterized protein LOC120768202 n=1 Tax=Bactrocera tryoni TaxID=59916 RepID=UPI001A956B2E|nr:uncharacterized protein LOC120768202 [Bactrocera tryoni]